MSTFGCIPIYNIIINDDNNNLSYINTLSENIVLTNSQISTLMINTKNKILNNALEEYDTLNEITNALSTEDSESSDALMNNINYINNYINSNYISFQNSISNYYNDNINLLSIISKEINTIDVNDFINDSHVSYNISNQISNSSFINYTLSNNISGYLKC